jgi:anti-sigma factor RsiW
MACESWKEKLDTYLDGELPANEMHAFDAHVRGCSSCAADALTRLQMKRAIQAAGKQFVPSAEFRSRVQQSIAPQRTLRSSLLSSRGSSLGPNFRPGWMFAAAVVLVVVMAGALLSNYVHTRSGREQASRDHIYSEVADLHVETLASSSPVDVVSTDRHTVKPWFQGKIPFAFNLPELQNTGFSLLGGRVTYLDQAPGAHLIYDVRKHHISVFIFQERAFVLPSLSLWSSSSPLPANGGENSVSPKNLPFNLETWSQGGLRYFVIGDASAADIDGLAKLFKATS